MIKNVYFDHASTTRLNSEVLDTYKELLATHYANSESLYDSGVKVKDLLTRSRKSIAQRLCVKENEIIFTSGASEANNLAIKGLLMSNPNKKHIITSRYEHSSVLEAIKQMQRLYDYQVTYLDILNDGKVDIEQLKNSIKDDTILVSIMWVNNEIGSINDINTIKNIIKGYPKTYLHVDAVQALGKIAVDLKDIDLCSFSAHKVNGLKGSGILYKKSNIQLEPLIIAGQQEYGIRGGTSNALTNVVLAKTIRLALDNQEKYHKEQIELIDYLVTSLESIKEVIFNSPFNEIGIINISTNIKSEIMLNALNSKGICVSAISTCHSKKTTSHVLEAIGLDNDRIRNSLRISINYTNSKEEIDYFIDSLKEVINYYGRI